MEENQFTFDVFLSHSAKDKDTVREVAERLRADGLRVWFDEWEIKPGDSIPAKVEEGLEHSRVLVLCMSANAFGSDWAQLESHTFRFNDPLNRSRRFIPLRLDSAPIKGLLAQFSYIDWLSAEHEREYTRLLEACQLPAKPLVMEEKKVGDGFLEKTIRLNCDRNICSYAFSRDGERVLTAGADKTVRLWDVATGQCLRVLRSHRKLSRYIEWSDDQRRALICTDDDDVRLLDLDEDRVLANYGKSVLTKRQMDCFRLLAGGLSSTEIQDWLRLYVLTVETHLLELKKRLNLETRNDLRDFATQFYGGINASFPPLRVHPLWVPYLAWDLERDRALSLHKEYDGRLRLCTNYRGEWREPAEGSEPNAWSMAWSADRRLVVYGSAEGVLRLWDTAIGKCLRVFEGHTGSVDAVSWNLDLNLVLSGSQDRTIRLWDIGTGHCLAVLREHSGGIRQVAWSSVQHRAFSGDEIGNIRIWNFSDFVPDSKSIEAQSRGLGFSPDQIQYTNAKVLLVGESGAGKTGLSKVLAGEKWEPSDSTVGAWATQWKLPVASNDGVEREIWLWDFGGQADQRLIHQLYMDETALAVLVFDGQKEDLFETLGQWDRDLTRASRKPFAKLLVAGRVDAGGLRFSRSELDKFAKERQFPVFLETSAKQNLGCEELKQAILAAINWDEIPCRTTEVLFKRLKEEIILLKDAGRVLMRFNELRETLQMRLSGESQRFTDEELRAVLTLLAGPGVVWELKFGAWVLLQPERINAYAQAVIQTLRTDEHERGCLPEERVLQGNLVYHSSIARLPADEERFILLAMHQTLLERGLCLREQTDKGPMLVFPSYYRCERPDLVGHPAVLVSYRFNGFLDDLYATLVVRLHHTRDFERDRLWRYAADFTTTLGQRLQLGVKLTRRAEGAGELEVYFDPAISTQEKIIFSRYVHEHLLQNAQEVERLRHYVCPHCGTPVENRSVAMKRLEAWLENRQQEPPTIVCVDCEKRVPLWDDLEVCFSSPEVQKRVRELQEKSMIVLDNQDKERALVGEVISTVALAGQISRELTVSDHGIDMEIEFKNDDGEATGQKLYLQLKSGDSYLRERKRGGAEIFTIKKERYARYWMAQAFPVLLIIRNSEGEVRWMEVRDWLKQKSEGGTKPVKQIVFDGERFDVMSVRRWRDRVLQQVD